VVITYYLLGGFGIRHPCFRIDPAQLQCLPTAASAADFSDDAPALPGIWQRDEHHHHHHDHERRRPLPAQLPLPICPEWYVCTSLHIDLTDPLGYPVTGATHGPGGTVVSDVEIRFEWQTSGEFDSNHFTLQKHYRAGAGLVWKVYYGGNVLRVEGGLAGNGLYGKPPEKVLVK
jgi:hypothetical protein